LGFVESPVGSTVRSRDFLLALVVRDVHVDAAELEVGEFELLLDGVVVVVVVVEEKFDELEEEKML
jgi:hypothetical protein